MYFCIPIILSIFWIPLILFGISVEKQRKRFGMSYSYGLPVLLSSVIIFSYIFAVICTWFR